jgi:hypothetical protein
MARDCRGRIAFVRATVRAGANINKTYNLEASARVAERRRNMASTDPGC